MNEFQLAYVPTNDLLVLRENINKELGSRKRTDGLAKRFAFIDRLEPQHQESKSEIERHNSSGLFSIPGHRTKKHASVGVYLPALLSQDWTHLYSGGDPEKKYYVYCHVNPCHSVFVARKDAGGNYGGEPFYVGKGTGNRAFDLKRNQGHGKKIDELLRYGIPPERIVRIVFDGLTEAKAFEIEAKLIYFFGTIYDRATKKMGILYNLEVPKVPAFASTMKEYPSACNKDKKHEQA